MAGLGPTSILLLWALSAFARAQDGPVVCTNGEGNFSARFETGVTVTAGATKQHGLAERSCEAALVSDDSRLTVVEGAYEVDVDVMGVDLGLGEPVVAIQFRKSEFDTRTTYEIYSLKKTPRLLRTLTGSAFFSVADYKLDGKIDIRTVDAAAVDGFEGIPLSSFDFVPPVFLRFENHKLVNVSAEYRQDFDHSIAQLRAGLDRDALAEFKQSDGVLATGFMMPMDRFRALIMVKIRVLEIVWAYLYSGRDDEAWHALDEMWPTADVDRVRVAILDARKRGIRAQVDEVSIGGPHRTRKLLLFGPAKAPEGNGNVSAMLEKNNAINLNEATSDGETQRSAGDRLIHADSNPIAIYMREKCGSGDCAVLGNGEVLMDLVVDDAGKVRSAKLVEPTLQGPAVDALLKDALSWKFIPAFKMGRPVACEMEQAVSLYR
jgi:hypothetical protein